MSYYQEIALLLKARIGLYDFWQKLYQQIHLALVEKKTGKNTSKIGVSFPEYNAKEFLLGTKLRLFAEDKATLTDMQCEKWLAHLHDYAVIGEITPVPEVVKGYACFAHIKLQGSKEKLARRRAKRHGETIEQAMAHFTTLDEQRSKLPYINMISQTTGRKFPLFIDKQTKGQAHNGMYSCYGLSKEVTVPIF